MFVFANDKERLYQHFQKDPVLFAYHIGDLDDFFFPHCQWAASYTTRRHPIVQDVVLIYHGGKIPTVMAFGVESGYADLLAETLDILPDQFFCHFQQDCQSVLAGQYDIEPLGTHMKMKCETVGRSAQSGDPDLFTVTSTDLPELEVFYQKAYPENYFMPRMLDTGWYRGIRINGKIAAVAGVHVVSDQYKIAVLGNIATDPAHRGRHLATRVTGGLTNELYRQGKLVCLNVKADNAVAIKCYERLGFATVHSYEEAICRRRS